MLSESYLKGAPKLSFNWFQFYLIVCDVLQNIAKGTTDPRVEFSFPKSLVEAISQVQEKILIKTIFKILTKHQLQNFNQTSASRLNLKFTILSRISTKIQLHNLYKTSATKYRPNSSFKFCLNFNFKILTKPCAQSLNKSFVSVVFKGIKKTCKFIISLFRSKIAMT